MNFDESKTNPPSPIELLFKQVKEQSDLCDVTIKLKAWEKRFHWCVLVASPYFDCIRKHGFLERESGVIAMQVGTPVALEQAILFLYGKKPRINSNNIAALIETAEYLTMPELKAECVRWIKRKKVTEDNCMAMIKLSSLYEFSLSTYEEYIEGHLPEMMLKDEMLEITPESVLYLLRDPRLSYTRVQDKFTFLIRWIKCQSKRTGEFERLLQCLNFEDSDADFIQNIVLQEPLVHETCSPSFIAELRSIDIRSTHDILLFPDLYQDNKLQCFDITRQRWCSVSIETVEPVPDGFYKQMARGIQGVQGRQHSDVYMVKNSYSGIGTDRFIYILNLETKLVRKSKITITTGIDNSKLSPIDQDIHNHELVLVSKEHVECEIAGSGELLDIPPHLLHQFLFARNPIDRMIARAGINSRRTKRFSISVLYVGQIEDETTKLAPILCLRKEISKVCSSGETIAMLSINAEELYLFDKVEFSLDVVSIKKIYNSIKANMSTLSAAGAGFVVYDKERCVNVARQIGPSLSCKWLTSISSFCATKDEERYMERYVCCENKWYRYKRNYSGPCGFAFTSHDKLSAKQRQTAGDDGRLMEIWEPMPTHPAEYVTPPSKIFQVTLSSERLSCSLNCPHCKQKENNRQYSYYGSYLDSDSDDEDKDFDLYVDLYSGHRFAYPYYDASDYYFDNDVYYDSD